MLSSRKTSAFEKILLIVAVLIIVIGYFLIYRIFTSEGNKLSWGFIQSVFLWLIIIIFIIFLAIQEDIKESALNKQNEEIKALRNDLANLLRNKKL